MPALRPGVHACVQVLELSKQQEITKQHEAREREAGFRAQAAMADKVSRAGRDVAERDLRRSSIHHSVCMCT